MKKWNDPLARHAEMLARYDAIVRDFRAGELSQVALDGWYNERLPHILAHVRSKSEFYAHHLRNVDIERVNLGSLRELPFTTKRDLQEQMFSMLSGRVNDAQFFFTTTGTTGPSTPCPRDRLDVFTNNQHIAWSMSEIFEEHFKDGPAPVVASIAPNELHSICTTFADVCEQIGVCKLDPYPASHVIGFEKCLKIIRDLPVNVLIGTPGGALILAKVAEKYGIDVKEDLNVRLIFATGEVTTKAMEKNLESIWGAKVYNYIYASQEALTMALASPANEYYLVRPNYIFEVIDPVSGEYLGATGEGELCVTMLMPGIKPLIRYRTGDMVNVRHHADRCSPYDYTISITGRTRDRIAINDRLFTAYEIEEAILAEATHCIGYQVRIERVNDEDVITVRLQYLDAPGVNKANISRRIVESSGRYLGARVSVEYVSKLESEANTGAWVSWKAARIVDRRGNVAASDEDLFEKDQAIRVADDVKRIHDETI